MIFSFSKLGNGGGGGGTADAAKLLESVSAIPASGRTGNVIATNIAEHQEWMDLEDFKQSGWTGVRGICSEETWLNVRFLGHENRYNGSFNGSEWINGGPENWYSGWNVTWDGNNWTATNNDWLSVSGTTDGDTWQIDFSIAAGGVNDGWDIPQHTEVYQIIPQKTGIYQANTAGTYVNALENVEYADEADFAREATCASWGFFIRNAEGEPWQDFSHAYDQRENDMFFDGNLLKINKNGSNIPFVFNEDNIPNKPLAPVSAAPVTAEEGIVYAVQNSGETTVKQALGTSGYAYTNYVDGATGYYGIKFSYPSDWMLFVVDIDDGTHGGMGVDVRWSNGDWDFSNWGGFTVSRTGNTWTATDNAGYGYVVDGYVDGNYAYVNLNAPVSTHYGVQGISEMRVPQTVYQTAVMSEQGVSKIWKGTQAEYDALVSGGTISNSTLYVIV